MKRILLSIPQAQWLEHHSYLRAMADLRPVTPRVKIEVLGGVADVTRCTPGVRVTIQDHDNAKAGE